MRETREDRAEEKVDDTALLGGVDPKLSEEGSGMVRRESWVEPVTVRLYEYSLALWFSIATSRDRSARWRMRSARQIERWALVRKWSAW